MALVAAMELVTRYRLRLADQADSRLGPLAGRYPLGAAGWTGPVAAYVGFYQPPATGAAEDLQQRLEEAWTWATERLHTQAAKRASVLLVALGPVPGALTGVPPGSGAVRVGAATIDLATASVTFQTPAVPGLPGQAELRRAAETVARGGPVPPLAAIDLAERQTVEGGYVAPARRALTLPPQATIGLIVACVVVYIVEILALNHFTDPLTGVKQYGAMYLATGAEPSQAVGGFGGPADWWRTVTAAFVHSAAGGGGLGLLHILGNCFALWILGRPIEQIFGRTALLATFLITAIGGNLAFLAVHQGSFAVGFGASGGVFGLIGLIAMLGRVQGRNLPVGLAAALRQWAIAMGGINLLFGLTVGQSVGISNSAHIGGLVTGVLVGLVLPPRSELGGRRQQRWEQAILLGVIAVSVVALGFGAAHLIDQLSSPFTG